MLFFKNFKGICLKGVLEHCKGFKQDVAQKF
jgi:hypothetical protein